MTAVCLTIRQNPNKCGEKLCLFRVLVLIITNSRSHPVEHLHLVFQSDIVPLNSLEFSLHFMGSEPSDAESQGFQFGEGRSVLV